MENSQLYDSEENIEETEENDGETEDFELVELGKMQFDISKIKNLEPEMITDEIKNARHEKYNILNIVIMENRKEQKCYIPIFNKRREIVDFSVIDIDKKEMVLKYTYSLLIVRNFKNEIINKYARSNKWQSLHEIIWGDKAPKKHFIDHRNNLGLDNTITNLGIASGKQNGQNKKKKPNCSSKYKGVTKKCNRWIARIAINGKTCNIGSYQTEELAGKAYDFNAYAEYGEFCKTNGMLNEKEIKDATNKIIPERFRITKKARDLPYGIAQDREYFKIRIQKGEFKLNASTKTLEKAIELRDAFIKKIEQDAIEKEDSEKNKSITRSIDNIAVIYVNFKGTVKECKVDDDVWYDVVKYSWQINNKDRIFSNIEGFGHISIHQYIYYKYVLKGAVLAEGNSVDHIVSKEKLDARISNLREATPSIQNHNQQKSEGIDKYNGVSFSGKQFHVEVKKNFYGSFDTEEEAAYVANKAAILEFGEFARLNDIDMTRTTTWINRISVDDVNIEFVKNIKYVKDLKNLINILELNVKNGGPIYNDEIKATTLEKYKNKVIDYLKSIGYIETFVKKEENIKEKKENIIDENIIMKIKEDIEEIKKIKHVNKLREKILELKLNTNNGGFITIYNIRTNNIETVKSEIVKYLKNKISNNT